MFQGGMLDKSSAPNHFVTFGFEDVGNVFPDDDVMYVLDGVPITLSSVIVLLDGDDGMTATYTPPLYTVTEEDDGLSLKKAGKHIEGDKKDLVGSDRGKWIVDVNQSWDQENDKPYIVTIGYCTSPEQARETLLSYAEAMSL